MTRLFVSDLDGTLLDASGQLSEVTRAELLRLLDVDDAVPELEGIAHEVIGPHHEHSVARYLASAAR
jgi:hydroxymethylpyrimidine pyrophosphatase-like HAD family hydrolase